MARTKGARRERLGQIRAAFSITRRNDPRLVPWMLGAFLVVLAVFVLVGVLVGHPVYFTVIGVMLGLMATTIVFGRRMQSSAYRQVEGQPGAAAAILQSMRGDWRVAPAVAATAQQDMVHRVVGRPGVVLVAEGAPHRLRQLLGQEKKRIGRVVGDTPVYDVLVGDEDGQVPLRKLQTWFLKLPRNIKPAEVNAVERRLQAIGGLRAPIPKGPLPRNAKMPGARRMQRGR